MILELYKRTATIAGYRFRKVSTPTPGAKKINSRLYDATHITAVAPTVTTAPVIAGTANVGQTLTCTPGVYAGVPAPTVTRQWKAGTANIPGATGLTYVVAAGDSGKSITCVETATNASGSVTGTSNAIAAP
jgi:hypothetical protein